MAQRLQLGNTKKPDQPQASGFHLSPRPMPSMFTYNDENSNEKRVTTLKQAHENAQKHHQETTNQDKLSV